MDKLSNFEVNRFLDCLVSSCAGTDVKCFLHKHETDIKDEVSTESLRERYVSFNLAHFADVGHKELMKSAINSLLVDINKEITDILIANAPAENSVGFWDHPLTETDFIQAVAMLVNNASHKFPEYFALLAPSSGAYCQFVQIPTVVRTQLRKVHWFWKLLFLLRLKSTLKLDQDIDQDIRWMGCSWSNSKLIDQMISSGSIVCTNVAWHPKALKFISRRTPIFKSGPYHGRHLPIALTGGIPMTLEYSYHPDLGNCFVIKAAYKLEPLHPEWAVTLKSN